MKLILTAIALLLISCGNDTQKMDEIEESRSRSKKKSKDGELQPFEDMRDRRSPVDEDKYKKKQSKSKKSKDRLSKKEGEESKKEKAEESVNGEAPNEDMPAQNPVDQEAAQIASGTQIYANQCSSCHRSDSIAEDDRVAERTLEELNDQLAEGHRGTNLTQEQIEDLAMAVEASAEE